MAVAGVAASVTGYGAGFELHEIEFTWHDMPVPGLPVALDGARLLMRERPPWEAEPPLEELQRAYFPKLVISGGHSPVFEAVCDAVASNSLR